MKATTNEKFCPSLRDEVETMVPPDVEAIYEIVINGICPDAVEKAMRYGIMATTKIPGVVKITAGNYGGKLGKYKMHLKEILR